MPEPGVHLQPGGGALGDADLQIAIRGLEHDRTADHLADADAAVGRLRVNTRTRPLDGDGAVRRAHPHVPGDRADRGVAVGVLDHGRALDVADLDPPGAGGDLGVTRDVAGGDVPGPRVHAQRAGSFEPDVPDGGLEPALPEPAGTAEVARLHLRGHRRTARQFDSHVDRPGLAGEVERTRLRPGDRKLAIGVVDADLLCGCDVGLVGFIARTDLDDGVGPVARGDPYFADAEFEGDGNRFGRLEF